MPIRSSVLSSTSMCPVDVMPPVTAIPLLVVASLVLVLNCKATPPELLTVATVKVPVIVGKPCQL